MRGLLEQLRRVMVVPDDDVDDVDDEGDLPPRKGPEGGGRGLGLRGPGFGRGRGRGARLNVKWRAARAKRRASCPLGKE